MIIVQCWKLTSIFGYTTDIIVPFTIILITSSLPFLRQLNFYYRSLMKRNAFDDLTISTSYQSQDKAKIKSFISWNEVLVYLGLNVIVFYKFGVVISYWLLLYIFSFFQNTFSSSLDRLDDYENRNEISWWQSFFFCLAAFTLYLSFVLYVFQKKQKFIRR